MKTNLLYLKRSEVPARSSRLLFRSDRRKRLFQLSQEWLVTNASFFLP